MLKHRFLKIKRGLKGQVLIAKHQMLAANRRTISWPHSGILLLTLKKKIVSTRVMLNQRRNLFKEL